MRKIKALHKVQLFFEEKIWDLQQDLPWWQDLGFGACRFIYLVLTGITKNKTVVRATALAYTTLLSIVPLIAVIMAFFKAFGGFSKVQASLEPFILGNLATGSGKIVQKYLLEFTQNLHAGALGVVGMTFLILTVVGLLSTIESAFNDIWGIKKKRSFIRRLTSYWTFVTVGPILVVVSLGATASLQSSYFLKTYLLNNDLMRLTFKCAPYGITWLLFTMLYVFMPNTKVRLRSALLGGVLAGTLWELAKYGYTVYVAGSIKYSAIYGSLGALPVFLIWLYLTWVIVLIGAEVGFAHQNIMTYREERRTADVSEGFKEFLALNVTAYICNHYVQQKGPVSAQTLRDVFKIPVRLIHEVLFKLCSAGIILEMGDEEHYYSPARPLDQITVKQVLEGLRSVGGKPPSMRVSRYEQYFKKALSDIDSAIEKASGRKNFKEIVSEINERG